MQQSRSDFIWFIATRLSALAIVVGAAALFVSGMEHDNISSAQAMAAHKAELASRLRKSPAVRSGLGSLIDAARH
jgi:hypothetical protein